MDCDTKTLNTRNIIIRISSIFLMIFSVLFSWTWANGYTLGDIFLNSIGLKAWSGNYGVRTHYTVFYSLGMMLVGFISYALTTKKKFISFLYFLGGFSVVFLFMSII